MALPELLKHIDIDARQVGENFMASCPFASETHDGGSDSTPSFGIHESTYVYHCFSCHKAGHIEQLVQYQLKVPLLEAIETVHEFIENYTAFHEAEYYLFGVVPKPPVIEFPEYFAKPFEGSVPKYLLNRGITIETAIEYGLGNDRRNKRLTFTVRNKNGKLVGLIGRSYSPRPYGPKYFNYVEFDKSRVLYGENIAWKNRSNTEPVIVVEGPMDVLKLAQAGFKRSVAIMGSHPSKEQVKRILSISPTVLAFLDNDKAGQAGNKVFAQRCPSTVFTVVHKLDKKDAGDYTEGELKTLLQPRNYQVIEYERKPFNHRFSKHYNRN